MVHRTQFRIVATMAVLLFSSVLHAQTRDEQVLADRQRLLDDASWVYDDLEQARKVAASEKRPLMVVLRCIP